MSQPRPKLLILDDDPDFLEVCRQMLSGLPSQPDIQTATSGTKALALLDSETFSLLLTDLRMPKMDGFQVLSIVRRRLPSQRIVVMTGATNETARARAYEMGIDLYVEKPKTRQETQLFFECIESLIERGARQSGFRGVVEHKGLVDIIQMECLTQSSAVLKITSGRSVGYIWFGNGEVIDAATATAKAEAAFAEILGWKDGSFDLLPPDPGRVQTIFSSAQALLLHTAQALDEAAPQASAEAHSSPLARLGQARGVEYVVERRAGGEVDAWGCEEAAPVASWAERMLAETRTLGDALQAGSPIEIEGFGPQRHLALSVRGEAALVTALERTLAPEEVRKTVQQLREQWAS